MTRNWVRFGHSAFGFVSDFVLRISNFLSFGSAEQEEDVPRRGLLELAPDLEVVAVLAATADDDSDEPDRVRGVGGLDLQRTAGRHGGGDGDPQPAGRAVEDKPVAHPVAEHGGEEDDADRVAVPADGPAAVGV